MKISIRQLKRLIREQVEEMGATAGFAEMDQLELDYSNPEELEEFEQELKHADWYYEMSDDSDQWRSGGRAMKALKDRAEELGQEGMSLFKHYQDKHSVGNGLSEQDEGGGGEGDEGGGGDESLEENSNSCSSNPPNNLRGLEEETEEGCHEAYTGGFDATGTAGTQAFAPSAAVVKEQFNNRAYKLLESLKKELDKKNLNR